MILYLPTCNFTFSSNFQAYRLEPLILRHYGTICPLPIHRFEGRQVPYHTIKTTALPAALKTGGEEMKGVQEGLVDAEQIMGAEKTSPGSSNSSSPQHLPKQQSTGEKAYL